MEKIILNDSSFKFKNLINITILIVFVSLTLDTIVQFNESQKSFYFYKDLTNFLIIIIALIAYLFHKIDNKTLIAVVLHSLLLNVMTSLPIRIEEGYNFEPYFLKVQFVYIVIAFALSIMANPIHMLVCTFLNLGFIIASTFFVHDYPLLKYLFYSCFSIGIGFAGYYFFSFDEKMKKANDLVKFRNQELIKLNDSKDELIKILGHDLKTPFSQLIQLSTLLEESKSETESNNIKSLIKDSANNGIKIIEDLTHWSKNLNQNENQKQLFSFYTLVEKVGKFHEIEIEKKKIEFINETNPNHFIIQNATIIETVLRNLIGNSIKFSNENSKIYVEALNLKGNHVEFKVWDFGIGIPKDVIHNLHLNKKIQSKNGTLNEKGSGLGLSFCIKAIDDLNGSMKIKSKENLGTTVSIKIPV